MHRPLVQDVDCPLGRLGVIEARDALEAGEPAALVDVHIHLFQDGARGHLDASAPSTESHSPAIGRDRTICIPTHPLLESVSSNLQLRVSLDESHQLLAQLSGRQEGTTPSPIESTAKRMKKAAAIAGLWHNSCASEHEVSTAAAHLLWSPAIVHPGIFVFFPRLSEVWTSICCVWPIAFVTASPPSRPGCPAPSSSFRLRASQLRLRRCGRRRRWQLQHICSGGAAEGSH
mmetsp:Transcript_121983/g.215033  ORF Transcript_121983/g.215033 Transcript_121983/m.215033 type:complete len:231 (+) Transcript_121983:76-768(+)